jgi:hypothetical protein
MSLPPRVMPGAKTRSAQSVSLADDRLQTFFALRSLLYDGVYPHTKGRCKRLTEQQREGNRQ